jgi:hypothetical protein
MTRTLEQWALILGVDEAKVLTGLADPRIKYIDLGSGVYKLRIFYRRRLRRIVRGL